MGTLNTYCGVGKVASVESKNMNDGSVMTNLRVAVNTYHNVNGKTEQETLWFELTTYSPSNAKFNRAKFWADRFSKGQVVHISGNPRLRIYMGKNNEPQHVIKLENGQIDTILKPGTNGAQTSPSADFDDVPF